MASYTHEPKNYKPRDTIDQIETLTEAWRYAALKVDQAIFWIRYDGRSIEEHMRHIHDYLDGIRLVSNYQEQMTNLGIQFEKQETPDVQRR